MTDESMQLIDRWQQGDESAAGEIYNRYVARLIALAGSRISPALARRVDAEDVVQSVYRSFFARTSDEPFEVGESGQLWGLLAAITINKVRMKVRFHSAEKRNVTAEASLNASVSCFGLPPVELAREPSSQEAAELAEQYELASAGMNENQREVFRRFLANESVEDIAKAIRRSTRTVRRELELIRRTLTTALTEVETESHA